MRRDFTAEASNDEMGSFGPNYLSVVSTNWARAPQGAIGVTVLRVRERVVLDFIIPGLDMEGGGAIPVDVKKNISLLIKHITY